MKNIKSQMVQRDKNELAAGYSKGHRRLEIVSIFLFTLFEIYLVTWIVNNTSLSNLDLFLGAVILGIILADFISGIVHWAADTWGSVDWPILGPSLIRPFREHHVDQMAITRHDFIETNGDSCLVSLPALLWASLQAYFVTGPTNYFLVCTLTALLTFVLLTNQIHSWSHAKRVAWPIRFCQKVRLILSPGHHRMHHTPPFDNYYCITTGWLNYPLSKVGFFRLLEKMVTKLTGAIPREDDIGLDAAIQISNPSENEQPIVNKVS